MYETLKHLFYSVCKPEESAHKSECLCCGQCCESFGGHLVTSKRDRERWRREGRDDLLSRVNRLGWIWVEPESKMLIDPCPFIVRSGDDKGLCRIYETRPDICRDYPTLAHGHRCLTGVFLRK